ncbi:heat shock 70 kDa protein 16 isoform X1 [Punica granatum]|uniref:Heat shock 70 kDa protein 16 isoform X1 n=1 Tax=Punica granatum TaxID=22663 RepID=A0A6P8EI54_PUNGR|nr:heat shock 70 kDa protein 16 isoform X1 [Punica granatum]
MSVVGFDIGNENCVVAAVKQRGIDVLLNDESKRETAAIVCFGEKQRFLGSAGAASAMMNPKSTISQLKRLIGRRFADPDVQRDLRMLPIETCEGSDGGVLVRIKYAGGTHTFTAVQIMAMLFAHLREVTEKNLEMPVSDCVIGVPSYFTDSQRVAYLNAASIAGLKPLRLIHDCTATALSYGIYKTDFSNRGPTYVAFVDIGHCDTQVCIASFESGQMKILSHCFDCNLGGRDFDEVLFTHFAAQFKQQYHIDVYSNAKASMRLRAACEKLKKVLSANAEAPLNIECLMDEKDVKGNIKREEFEKLASGLLERIAIPCKKAVADSRLSLERIHSVELVGSGSRIPAITRMLASLFEREPRRTLNASECVARGCALQCAMLSPVFRVREYEVQDSIPFSIGFSTNDSVISAGSNAVLFPRGQPFPIVKFLTLQRSSLFYLEAFYANADELPSGTSAKIGSFMIGPFKGSHGEKTKVKVRVQLNLHGIVGVDSAMLAEDNAHTSVAGEDTCQNAERVYSDTTSANDQHGLENGTSTSHASQDHGTRRERAMRKLEVPVNEKRDGGISEADLAEFKEKEAQLAEQDRIIEQTKERKNALESYVYETRNKLLNTYRSFASNSEREGISRSLQQTEDWLYDEGDDETENAYNSKLKDLKKLVDPIENRFKDEEARAQATRDLLNCIVEYRMSANSLPPEHRDLIINECDRAEQWLRERSQQQDSLPKNMDPVLWSSDIKSVAEDLNSKCRLIWNSKTPSTLEDGRDSDPNSSRL